MPRKPKKTIFLLVFALLIVVSGIFLLQDISSHATTVANNEEAIAQLITIQQQMDDAALQQRKSSIASNLSSKKSELQQIVDEAVESGATNTNERQIAPSQSEYSLNLLGKLYDKTNNTALLPTLFQFSLDFRKFDQALEYLLLLQSQSQLDTQVDMNQYLYALFNSAELDFGQINRLKQIVDEYLDQNLITQADHTMYYSLITLIKNDQENYKIFMSQLRGTAYDNQTKNYDTAVARADSFVDTPDYYLQWLLAIGVFNNGWYRITQKIARSLIAQDARYILAYQLDAYASIMLWDRNQAIESLDYLTTNDPTQEELYHYLSGISFFYLQKYTDAILSFAQLESQKYNTDVLRYSLLSYSNLGDPTWVLTTIDVLLSKDSLTIYDYFWIFDEVFFGDAATTGTYIQQLSDQLDALFRKCYADMDWEKIFACVYGKSGLYLAQQDYTTAYQYLQRVVQRYPQPQLYEYLGDIAQQLDSPDDATKRYIQWLMQSSVLDDQQLLRDKIKGLMR